MPPRARSACVTMRKFVNGLFLLCSEACGERRIIEGTCYIIMQELRKDVDSTVFLHRCIYMWYIVFLCSVCSSCKITIHICWTLMMVHGWKACDGQWATKRINRIILISSAAPCVSQCDVSHVVLDNYCLWNFNVTVWHMLCVQVLAWCSQCHMWHVACAMVLAWFAMSHVACCVCSGSCLICHVTCCMLFCVPFEMLCNLSGILEVSTPGMATMYT